MDNSKRRTCLFFDTLSVVYRICACVSQNDSLMIDNVQPQTSSNENEREGTEAKLVIGRAHSAFESCSFFSMYSNGFGNATEDVMVATVKIHACS